MESKLFQLAYLSFSQAIDQGMSCCDVLCPQPGQHVPDFLKAIDVLDNRDLTL